MKTTADYIDALRAKFEVNSDFAAMSKLGCNHRQQVSKWRKLHGSFDEHLSLKVADALGIDRAEVLLAMQIQRESDQELKNLWKRIATLSTGITAVLIAIAILPYPLHLDSLQLLPIGFIGGEGCILCQTPWAFYAWVLLPLAALALYHLPAKSRRSS